MEVSVSAFLDGMNFLGITVVEKDSFDYEDWSSAEPLLPAFTADLEKWNAQYPGFLNRFKLAYQYMLSLEEFAVGDYVEDILIFGFPRPDRDFLIFVWERVFPGEPWKREFPADMVVNWKLQ